MVHYDRRIRHGLKESNVHSRLPGRSPGQANTLDQDDTEDDATTAAYLSSRYLRVTPRRELINKILHKHRINQDLYANKLQHSRATADYRLVVHSSSLNLIYLECS